MSEYRQNGNYMDFEHNMQPGGATYRDEHFRIHSGFLGQIEKKY
jgi:hypothetical protein